MESSEKRRQKFKSVLLNSLTGIIIGSLFTDIAFGFDMARTIKGATAGFIITFLITLFEKFVFLEKFRRLRFSSIILIRTLVYVLVISFAVIFVWVIHESGLNETDIISTLRSSDFSYFILKGDFKNILVFAIIVSIVINLFTQVNNLLGKGVFLNYVTGKYHKPKEEERSFMFLDLTSSTTIAEKLRQVRYHRFISSCFFDIDEAIIESKGEIYQYVGDEVIISWKHGKGFDRGSCIKCYFKIEERLQELSKEYEKKFGFIPEFKAGLHCGHVVTGEVGDSKKEVVFHGDVLNTASRIQAQCNTLGAKFIASRDILDGIELPPGYKSESLGKLKLRGREQEIELFKITKT